MKALVVAAALLVAPPAHAEEYTASVGLAGLVYHGLSVELERDLPRRGLAVAGGLSFRSTADGDYDSATVGVAGEVRWFWKRRAGRAVGFYAAARLDLARTQVTDAMGEDIGGQSTVGVSWLAGYRLAPWRGLEVRPYGGLAVRRDTGGRLAGWTRPGLALGLAVGWSW